MNSAESLLHNIYLFKDLTTREMETVARATTLEHFSTNDVLFSEGEEAHSIYVVRFGSVRVEYSREHDRTESAIMGTGAHFGELSFLDHMRRTATVTVLEPSEIVRVEFKALQTMLDEHPAIAMRVYKALAIFLCNRVRVTQIDLSHAREKNRHHV